MDGRYEEVYTQAKFLRNDAFYDLMDLPREQNAVATIQHSPADFVLLEAQLSGTGMLIQSGQWQMIYGDQYFVVLARKTSLSHYPSNATKIPMVNDKLLTIGDMVTPADLRRFKD